MRERAVRMVREHEGYRAARSAAVRSVTKKVGRRREMPRRWLRQVESDDGARPAATREERDRIRQCKSENREPRQADGILRKGEGRPPIGFGPWTH
jgi:transposase-like protein